MPVPFRLPPAVRPTRDRLATDRRGVTAVEFSFIVGPLIALLIAILQISLTFFAQQNLETVAEKATRALMTGSAQASKLSQSGFKTLACSKLPGFMQCAKLMIDVQVANSFSDAAAPLPTITYDAQGNPNNSWRYDPGTPGSIVIVKTMYVWNVAQGPLGFNLSTMSGGRRLLIATSVFKTEPYTA